MPGSVSDDFDELIVEGYLAPANGYLLVYISNEDTEKVPVHFDDIEITLKQKELLQADDYYPFGLTFNSFERAGNIKNDYL